MYTNYEILTIFKHCHSKTEVAYALLCLLYVLEDGDLSESTKRFIYQRGKIRERQL